MLQERLETMLEPVVSDLGYELLLVEYSTGSGHGAGLLRLYIDHADGIAVEDCERVSREVSGVLDVEDPIASAYTLEVSSPGLARPLVRPRDFQRFAGFEARVETAMPIDGRRRSTGRLGGVNDDEVLVEDDAGTDWRIPFAAIHRAKLLLTDELIAPTEEQRSDD